MYESYAAKFFKEKIANKAYKFFKSSQFMNITPICFSSTNLRQLDSSPVVKTLLSPPCVILQLIHDCDDILKLEVSIVDQLVQLEHWHISSTRKGSNFSFII